MYRIFKQSSERSTVEISQVDRKMMQLEDQEFQATTRSGINGAILDAIQDFGHFIETISPIVIAAAGALVVGLYTHMYFVLPWVLWKHMLSDTVVLLMLPFLMAVSSDAIEQFCDFLKYENLRLRYGIPDSTRDVELYVWEAPKYYDFVDSTSYRYISEGYSVTESASEHDAQEETIGPKAETDLKSK